MHFYIVAFSLPRAGYYMTIHKHETPDLCKWTADDRDTFTRIRDQVERLYTQGPAGLPMNRMELDILYVPGIEPAEAVKRILPYYLKCYSANKRRIVYPHKDVNEIEVLGPAGTEEEDFGLRLAVIGKGVHTLHFQPWVLQQVSELRGTPFTAAESQTLEGRSDRTLVEVVARATQPVADEGFAKIVAIPKECSVRLSRRGYGEFISEIPKVWA
jgi:hypothetical protein